jgi:integral membrane protein
MKSPLFSSELFTTAMGRFRAMAIICGINLILLVFYMVAKYAFNAFDEGNPFIVIPIAHGYFYIVYILTVLQLAVQKRISLPVIIALVAAGTIPLTSFIAERKIVAKYS